MKRKNKPQLNEEGARLIQGKVEWEGDFLYVMENWDFHEEITDKKFRSLRKAFIKAAIELKDYCRIDEEFDEPTTGEEGRPDYEDEEENENICEQCGNPAGDEFHICT